MLSSGVALFSVLIILLLISLFGVWICVKHEYKETGEYSTVSIVIFSMVVSMISITICLFIMFLHK